MTKPSSRERTKIVFSFVVRRFEAEALLKLTPFHLHKLQFMHDTLQGSNAQISNLAQAIFDVISASNASARTRAKRPAFSLHALMRHCAKNRIEIGCQAVKESRAQKFEVMAAPIEYVRGSQYIESEVEAISYAPIE